VTSELRMHLNKSKTYKQAKIGVDQDLIEAHYHEKDYIGKYLEKSHVTMNELKALEAEMKTKLEFYCAHYNVDGASLFIIPQVFIK
jgi:hypothetical protein